MCRVWGSDDASIFTRMSAGVFLPTPTCLTDSQKDFTIASSKTAQRQALQIHVQLNPYPCLRLFLKKTSMGIPPSPPRVTVTLGLGLIKSHSPVSYIQIPQSFRR